jgi:Zn-dependent protease
MFITNLFSNPIAFIIFAIMIVLTIALHEFAHAKMADHLGDPTPKIQGRLTLNPIAHIDPLGLILLFIVGFGWGKPVQFDPFNLKHPRQDAALISIAGPGTNFLLAIISSVLMRIFLVANIPILSLISELLLVPFITINVLLGIFNLLPIAPLDGFKIVGGLLSEKQAKEWYSLERYGMFFLLALLIPFGNQSILQGVISPLIQFVTGLLIPH